MSGLRLFLKSRRAISLLLLLVGLAAAGFLLGGRQLRLGERSLVPVPWAVLVPVLSGYVVAAAAVSPIPWLEYLAVRRVAALNRTFLAVAALLEVALLIWSTAALPGPLSTPAAVRDFAGALGLSLLSVTVLGVTAGWLVPVGVLFAAIALRSGEVSFLPLDWLVRHDGDVGAALVAGGLLVAGVASTWTARLRLRPADE